MIILEGSAVKQFKNDKLNLPSLNVIDVSYLFDQALEEEFIRWHNACYDRALSVGSGNLCYFPRKKHHDSKVIPFKNSS